MNISTKITNDGKQSIIVEMTPEEATHVMAGILAAEKGAPEIVMPMLAALKMLPVDAMNETVSECEKNAEPKHAHKVIMLKLMQARLLLIAQEKGRI